MLKWLYDAIMGPPEPTQPDYRIVSNGHGRYMAMVRENNRWYDVDRDLILALHYDHSWRFERLYCTSEQQAGERLNEYLKSANEAVVWEHYNA